MMLAVGGRALMSSEICREPINPNPSSLYSSLPRSRQRGTQASTRAAQESQGVPLVTGNSTIPPAVLRNPKPYPPY